MHCDSTQEVHPDIGQKSVAALVRIEVRQAIVQNVASLSHMKWVHHKRCCERCSKVSDPPVRLQHSLLRIQILLDLTSIRRIAVNVQDAPTISFVEAKNALAIESLYALSVRLIDWSAEGLIKPDLP